MLKSFHVYEYGRNESLNYVWFVQFPWLLNAWIILDSFVEWSIRGECLKEGGSVAFLNACSNEREHLWVIIKDANDSRRFSWNLLDSNGG